jgi:hypothetical protein
MLYILFAAVASETEPIGVLPHRSNLHLVLEQQAPGSGYLESLALLQLHLPYGPFCPGRPPRHDAPDLEQLAQSRSARRTGLFMLPPVKLAVSVTWKNDSDREKHSTNAIPPRSRTLQQKP